MKKYTKVLIIILVIYFIVTIAAEYVIKDKIINEIEKVKGICATQPELNRLEMPDFDSIANSNVQQINVVNTSVRFPFNNLQLIEKTEETEKYENENYIVTIIKNVKKVPNENAEKNDALYTKYVNKDITDNKKYILSTKDMQNIMKKYSSFFELKKESYMNTVYKYNYFMSNSDLKEVLFKYYFRSKNVQSDKLYYFNSDNSNNGFIEIKDKSYYIDMLSYQNDVQAIQIDVKDDTNGEISEMEIISIIKSINKEL